MRSHISMTKRLSLVLVLLMFSSAHLRGQQWTDPLLYYPRFEDCSSESREALPNCFTQHINLLMQEASKSWGIANSSKGQVSVLFEVDKSGEFVLRYIDSPSEPIRAQVREFFTALPVIEPANYNGRTIYMQFKLHFSLSDLSNLDLTTQIEQIAQTDLETIQLNANRSQGQGTEIKSFARPKANEYGAVVQDKYQGQGYQSDVLIPLSHRRYDEFEAAMNQIGSNNHTAQKPYRFSEVQAYCDIKAADSSLKKTTKNLVWT